MTPLLGNSSGSEAQRSMCWAIEGASVPDSAAATLFRLGPSIDLDIWYGDASLSLPCSDLFRPGIPENTRPPLSGE